MKRISLWLVLLALTPDVTEAYYYYYVPARYRIHYSPYALRYGSSGLVPGGLDYSVYAFDYSHTGLVYEGTRYTPYALQYGSTGLITDYYAYPYPMPYGYPCTVINNYYGCRPARRPPPGKAPGTSPQYETPNSSSTDGMNAIRQYLRAKGFNGVSVNRILRIDNALVSVDFTLRDQNLLIKYWDPKQVERLSGTDAKSCASAAQQKVYAKYKQDWDRFAQQYRQSGGEIYNVDASDQETIVAALQACPRLEGVPNAEGCGGGPQTGTAPMYAKN